MPLLPDEARLFEAACGDRTNEAARELQNALGVVAASDVMKQVIGSPAIIRTFLMEQVRRAIAHQRTRVA